MQTNSQTTFHARVDAARVLGAGFLRALSVSIVMLSALALGNAQAPQSIGITVNGVGTAYGAPDTAVLDLGVSLYHADVSQGLAQADERMQAIREALVAAGVEASDIRTTGMEHAHERMQAISEAFGAAGEEACVIRTTGLSVWREQQYDPQGNPTTERYNIWHNYNVTVRDPELVGAVINAAVVAGANNIGGVNFTIADPSVLERTAREDAIADARERAEHLAELLGVTLGEPIAITEGTQGFVPLVRSAAMDMGSGGIAAGELAVTVNVTVTFSLGSAE